jgi:hypothetical protein
MFACFFALLPATIRAADADPAKETPPDNSGPVKLLTASWLGGKFDDDIVGVAIAADGGIWLAGNTVDLALPEIKPTLLGPAGTLQTNFTPAPPKKGAKAEGHPSMHGFLARLAADGQKAESMAEFGYGKATIKKLFLDDKGQIYLLGSSSEPIDLGVGKTNKGTFVATLSADGSKVLQVIPKDGIKDFAVDGNGEVVVLVGAKMTRFSADGKTEQWTVGWKSFGNNVPGAIALAPATGVASVVGYGMTHTGKEPYKDPYGYGFDRDGKQVWAVWNPDPKKEKSAKFASEGEVCNGLMADTTGHAASASGSKIFFMLFADGGNSVCTRDPLDVDKPLDKSVFDGVYQNGPGYGFKGASKTSVIFRLDAEKGVLEKGTWMCAWLDRAHANGLGIDAAAQDANGRQFLVGGSAFGCPTKQPWYVCREGGYQGGGFLAIFDANFKMEQCGYFPATNLHAVASRGNTVVVAGSIKEWEDAESKTAPRIFKPLQKAFGGGERDAFFAVFQTGTK